MQTAHVDIDRSPIAGAASPSNEQPHFQPGHQAIAAPWSRLAGAWPSKGWDASGTGTCEALSGALPLFDPTRRGVDDWSLLEAAGPPCPDEHTGPIFWLGLSPDEAGAEWAALRAWVEELTERFSHLDHHVIPRCWFRHNGHVEALAALRDNEQFNYDDKAPGTAAVDWHRAFRDIEARLREWTGQLACGATHWSRSRPSHVIDPEEWEQFVNDDVNGRDCRAINASKTEWGSGA